ncbi:FAD-binding protein [Parafilimonas sp.]|uniref:FAD-binding oxidoreductase n=1 Tax=Parafilimonas sp. TaxID=1969739 RepID=UPI0039E63A2D
MAQKNIANWGNYPVIESNERSFSFDDQLEHLVEESDHFIPRGNGRCYGDASLAEETISTLKYDKVLSFDTVNGILECQSGLTLDKILEIIVPKGWFLPVTPGTKFITVGGAVGSDVHGKNHHVDGSFSSHIMEMQLILADSSTIICSPEKNADLFEATCGGMGLTGLVTRVKFRLKKIETSYIKQKQIKAESLDDIIRLFEEYKDYTYSVAWIDCLKKGKHFGRSILILGEHAKVEDLPEKLKSDPLKLPKKIKLNFPFNLPSFALNQFTVKAFNFLFYGKNFKKEIDNVVSYEPFFYPLDVMHNWNRMYGKRGFVQYQFVLPLNSKQGLIEIVKKINERNMGSFLTVLKVFGQQESIISFPKEGYTLALDFPVRKGLFEFLDELDQVVLQYGGRLYMSKDARMKPEVLKAGYPELDTFRQIVNKYNPTNKIRSVQSKRLGLTA